MSLDLSTIDEIILPDGSQVMEVVNSDGTILWSGTEVMNMFPTGSASITEGTNNPAIGDTLEMTANFTDPDGDALTYQWQFSDGVTLAAYDNSGPFYDKTGLFTGSAADGWAAFTTPTNGGFVVPNGNRFYVALWNDSQPHTEEPELLLGPLESFASASTTTGFVADPVDYATLNTFIGTSGEITADRFEIQEAQLLFTNLQVPTPDWAEAIAGDDIVAEADYVDYDNSATTGASSFSSAHDGNPVLMGLINTDSLGERVSLITSNTYNSGDGVVIAIWESGVDHSSTAPVFAALVTSTITSTNIFPSGYYNQELNDRYSEAAALIDGATVDVEVLDGINALAFAADRVEIFATDSIDNLPSTLTNANGVTLSIDATEGNDLTAHPGGTTGVGTITDTAGTYDASLLSSGDTDDHPSAELDGVVAYVRHLNIEWSSDQVYPTSDDDSILAVFAAGSDHATATPLATWDATVGSPESQWTSGRGWRRNTNIDLDEVYNHPNAITTDTFADGSDAGSVQLAGLNAADVEIWVGTTTIPTGRVFTAGGAGSYRVQVSDGTDTVTSNIINILNEHNLQTEVHLR